jgi:hypothetical protein
MEPIVFFSRCKPQDVDAIDIVLSENRLFIGWPMRRAGAPYDRRNLRACVVDPSCGDDEWANAHAASDKSRQFNQNRNLVRKVTIGSIAMVPRPDFGVIYCGRITSKFELVNSPPWYERYMQIRGDTDGERFWHAADVAQCWTVDRFKPIPVPRVPQWIRRSLFGRSTYGVIHPDDICGDPYEVISRIIETDDFEQRLWTLDLAVIEMRMLTDLSPTTFEHLLVALLQLEHPNEVWSQVGGSGDGGIDGVGADANGEVAGLLQCKWQFWGQPTFPTETVWRARARPYRRYLAALRYPEGVVPQGCEFLSRSKIAELVAKHYARLPQALSMRIGVPTSAFAP